MIKKVFNSKFLSCQLKLQCFVAYIYSDDSFGGVYYSVHRRRTDLMPTIPSPRDTCRSSIGTHTPRTPGIAIKY